MEMQNDLILRAARGEETPRVPVWLMRQAGRILPQYRKVREKVGGFKQLVENPELAAEVTLQPVEALGVDAAIIFSDILVVPEAMGLSYDIIESQGPFFKETVRDKQALSRLKDIDPEHDLHYVLKAIKLVKSELNGKLPLIGFSGAPWTLFAYMTEGSGSKTYSHARRLLYLDPEFSGSLIHKLAQNITSYLIAQIEAGADLVMLFDSWAGLLSEELYQTTGFEPITKICNAIKEKHPDVPIIVFSKGAWFGFKYFQEIPCEVVGLDWTMSPGLFRKHTNDQKTLQGNLDPCVLYASRETIRNQTLAMLKNFGTFRYIANLGHGVYPDTPLDGVRCFIETIQQYEPIA